MQCDYCYEEPLREAGNFSTGYDMELMKRGLEKENWHFSLFGGEPLLMPFADLEEIFRWGLEKFQSNGIQTNGTLITEDHIQLFIKYNVGVGISMDGPDVLNDSRWMGSLEKTRAATEQSMWAVRRLCEVGRAPSMIFTLYQGNATRDRLPRLLNWLQELESLGVKHMRVHLLEIESPTVRSKMALTDNENVAALMELYELQKRSASLRFDLFDDMRKLLMGTDQQGTSCIWNACDSYTTRAVRGIDGLGNNVNCGRTNKEGVDWGKANTEGFERQLALHQTPQSKGGCSGCRFFFACKGQCPGTAIDGDWRNRSEQCQIWFRMFQHLERELIQEGQKPISRSSTLPKVEAAFIASWEKGINMSVSQAVAVSNGSPAPSSHCQDHGDHWDAPDGYAHDDGILTVHGDAGMTQMHQDSDR
ncbi:AslB Arylsulfatase regulator (Fe-S oxidoreductase) [uncultured Caudovirales phage]|uniref:AslB Arylsulfatase regulator (Fe-S oxidoreductase) n=1 Tax=uncultured Caudovirales phage TaxID=2100421 RepID=A0A6J5R191_9CAUD|nr:AslB Arylsulfatase regulator (Fe-S oxidoreductase) [uncultured Caudovirales phage]